MDWTSGSTRLQKSLGIRDWQAAQRRARDMEADGIDAYLTGDSGALAHRECRAWKGGKPEWRGVVDGPNESEPPPGGCQPDASIPSRPFYREI